MSVTTAAPDAVPEDEPQVRAPQLLDHTYDGIHEYDNPLPGWWSTIFVVTIVFAAMYGFYFHVANWGTSPGERYATQLGEFNDKKSLRDRAEAANVNEAALARISLDSKLVDSGAKVFAAKCVSCHTADGRGEIGPNLTDRFQLHGETRMDIYRTIHAGVPGTAMIAWGDQLSAADVLEVAAFVATLRGKDIPGKGPQGAPVGTFAP